MKQKFLMLTAALMLGLATSGSAQGGRSFYKTPYKSRNSGSFDRTSGLLTFSYGFPNRAVGDYGAWNYRRSGFGPLYVKYEHGIIDEVGIGGYIAGAAARHRHHNHWTDRETAISMGAMGYYHFNKIIPVRQLDVYAGAGIGFRTIGYRYDDDYVGVEYDRSHFDVLPLVKVGARFYFNRVFGVYGEGGYDGMSDVNLGITFRF
jgi:hypothetical protein